MWSCRKRSLTVCTSEINCRSLRRKSKQQIERKYKFKRDFCPRRFKDKKEHADIQMQIHLQLWHYGRSFWSQKDCRFGHVDNRWLLVKWVDYQDPEWNRQHLLERDGCHEAVREFWSQSGLNPCEQFITDWGYDCLFGDKIMIQYRRKFFRFIFYDGKCQ